MKDSIAVLMLCAFISAPGYAQSGFAGVKVHDLRKNLKGKTTNLAHSSKCGLLLEDRTQSGEYSSDRIELSGPTDLLFIAWGATIPNEEMTIRASTSRDTHTWSDWALSTMR